MATKTIAVPASRSWAARNLGPAIGAAIILVGGLYIFDPRSPFTLSEGWVETPVYPGQTLKVDWVQDWRRLCRATSVREVVRSDKKVDRYDGAPINPPAKTGATNAVGEAALSLITPPGPAIYRATVTFPAQISSRCILPMPITFTTPDVHFVVQKLPSQRADNSR